MTTLLEFAQGLANLAIPGVTRDFGMDRPKSLNTADLPAKWLQAVGVDRERFALDVSGPTAHGVGLDLSLIMVIALEPVGEGVPEVSFYDTVVMSDNVTLAVTKADVALSWPKVATRVTQIPFQGAQEYYWALVSTITATG